MAAWLHLAAAAAWPAGSLRCHCTAAFASLHAKPPSASCWRPPSLPPLLPLLPLLLLPPPLLPACLQVVLEIKGETQLRGLSAKLEEAGVAHKLWVEQPEDYATCLATAPAPKSRVAPLLKKLKLCRGT